MLHAGMAPPGADRFVERVVGADRAELLAVARAEAADRVVVEQHLADRAQCRPRRASPVERWVSGSKLRRLSSVSPKKSSRIGSAAPAGIEIDDAAAHREFAGLAHRIGADIAVVAEKALQPVERDAAAGPQRQHAAVEQLARRHALHQRVDRGQHDRAAVGSRPAASRVKVSMRRLTISPFGDTRS